ncbi:MAG: hypothetical protein IJJ99_04255 [Oscillospiraceae bacterium]|nr:hypothetical protein [Oscillospiraceae bacterium]
MKRAIALILLFSLLLALCGCGGKSESDPSEQQLETNAAKAAQGQPYEGEIPKDIFGIYDEESYVNNAFGVKYQRDGSWSFYTLRKLADLNGSSDETVEVLKRTGFVYDMYASSGLETIGFALAIPSSQFGKAMTEEAYAQAVKEASARDYAGADYDVISDEVGAVQFGGAQHACYYLTVAANGMVFHTVRIFLQRDDFIGIIYISADSDEHLSSLLSSFSGV